MLFSSCQNYFNQHWIRQCNQIKETWIFTWHKMFVCHVYRNHATMKICSHNIHNYDNLHCILAISAGRREDIFFGIHPMTFGSVACSSSRFYWLSNYIKPQDMALIHWKLKASVIICFFLAQYSCCCLTSQLAARILA